MNGKFFQNFFRKIFQNFAKFQKNLCKSFKYMSSDYPHSLFTYETMVWISLLLKHSTPHGDFVIVVDDDPPPCFLASPTAFASVSPGAAIEFDEGLLMLLDFAAAEGTFLIAAGGSTIFAFAAAGYFRGVDSLMGTLRGCLGGGLLNIGDGGVNTLACWDRVGDAGKGRATSGGQIVGFVAPTATAAKDSGFFSLLPNVGVFFSSGPCDLSISTLSARTSWKFAFLQSILCSWNAQNFER